MATQRRFSSRKSNYPDTEKKVFIHFDNDDVVYQVRHSVMNESETYKTVYEDVPPSNEDIDFYLSGGNCSARIFEKIYKYMKKLSNNPEHKKYFENKSYEERWLFSEDDTKFLGDLTIDQKVEMIVCVNYIEVPFLLDLLSRSISHHLDGLTPNEVKEFFKKYVTGFEDEK